MECCKFRAASVGFGEFSNSNDDRCKLVTAFVRPRKVINELTLRVTERSPSVLMELLWANASRNWFAIGN